MRKAQTQAITLVLISGIVISLVGIAYMWGKPMIEKRSVMTQFTSALRFVEDLDKKIADMAGTCSFEGACEESFELPVPGLIRLYAANNTITYEFQVNQPLITKDEVLFNTINNGSVARYGETPGVISLKGEELTTGTYSLRFSIRYRELDSNEPPRSKGYIIKLIEFGTTSGNNRIIISYGGSETQPEQAYNKGDLVISKIKVKMI